jgi:predicted aminopeptidase
MRAGWEEARILLKRKPLTRLIESPETEEPLKAKFRLVLDARKFAKSIGLKPKNSYTQYAAIDRDVLVWVLSASPKLSLTSVTWWFPIVGRVPYKGFFEKDDGLAAAHGLHEDGFDIYLRPSPAFSTLGWFDDPLLSTIAKDNEVLLVNTVIHEILHNTLWVPGHVTFNETLANFIGSMGAYQFFKQRQSPTADADAGLAQDLWHDELIYAAFLDDTVKKLKQFYESLGTAPGGDVQAAVAQPEALIKREQLFAEAAEAWKSKYPELKTRQFRKESMKLNNAVVLAEIIYQDRPWVFTGFYKACGNSLEKFVQEMILIKKQTRKAGGDPYQAVAKRTAELEKESMLAAAAGTD